MSINYTSDITILCRVVDNFGDVGFAYRLARALKNLQKNHFKEKTNLRLVIDDLHSFSLLAPGINEKLCIQEYCGFTVYDWNANTVCTNDFVKHPPLTILQCFQCGYPDWLEELLFNRQIKNEDKDIEKKNLSMRQNIKVQKSNDKHIVHVINIDYLTAEPYAEEFHLLASLTRSSLVQKINFMPGFTKRTGGLLLNRAMLDCRMPNHNNLISEHSFIESGTKNSFNILVFAYEQNFEWLVNAIASFKKQLNFNDELKEQNNSEEKNASVHAFVAAGNMQEHFLHAWKNHKWENCEHPFQITQLAFLSQENWDSLLFSCDMLFVRGEDSLASACLSGLPFIWQAYKQDDDYQLVKVRALLSLMQPFFSASDFELLSTTWLLCNTTHPLTSENDNANPNKTVTKKTNCVYNFLQKAYIEKKIASGKITESKFNFFRKSFSDFTQTLLTNGDFAKNLFNYLERI